MSTNAIKKGLRKGMTIRYSGKLYRVSRKGQEGVEVTTSASLPDSKGRFKMRRVKTFLPWSSVDVAVGLGLNGAGGSDTFYTGSRKRYFTKRKATPKRKATTKRKAAPKKKGPLSKVAFLRRMAEGRAKAARRRARG